MAFNGNNMTPLGGNARAGNNAQDRNAPMGWAYESKTDDLATIQTTGYFDTFNSFLQAGQFIYVFSADDQKVFLLVDSVDKTLKQVTIDSASITPVPLPNNVVFVQIPADIPDPLDSNITYRLFDFIEKQDGDIIQLPVGSINRIESSNAGVNNLQYNGTGTFINGVNVPAFSTESSFINKVGGGSATLFDVDAGIFPDSSIFSAFRQAYNSWTEIGTIKGFFVVSIMSVSISNSGQLTLENNQRFSITNTSFSPGNDPLTLINIIGESETRGNISTGEWEVKAGQSAIFIDPNIGANSRISINTVKVELEPGGEFFKSGVAGDISNIVDNTSNGVISSVVTDAQGILVTTSIAHNLEPSQEVAQSTGVPDYDVPTNILSVPSIFSYVLPLSFSVGAVGTYIANSVTVTTSAPHGQSDGQTLLVNETIDYNGGAAIYLASGSVFNINRTFENVETAGIFDTGSLTQKDPRVTVEQVEGVPNSKVLFNFGVISALATTSMGAQDTFQDINFSGATPFITGTELFTLIDADSGEFRYEGLEDIELTFNGFAVCDAGAIQVFEFVPAINGISQETSIVPSQIEIRQASDIAPFAGIASLTQGDTIKMQVASVGATEDIQIGNFSLVGAVE